MTDRRTDVRKALREVRRERLKAALVDGVVDGVLALLVVNLALSVVELPGVPATVGPVPVAAAAGVGVGLLVTVVGVAVRTRQDAVRHFEGFNPEVETALRSARDAVAEEQSTVMARLLYEDVVDRLRETSSRGFLNGRTLALRMVVVVAVSLASVHVAVVGLEFGPEPAPVGGGSAGGSGTGSVGGPVQQDSLDDPSAVLGDAEDVDSGSEDLAANVSTGGSGRAGEGGAGEAYESGGLSSGDVSAQRAGFDAPEELEDADLIREYNVRLSSEESDE